MASEDRDDIMDTPYIPEEEELEYSDRLPLVQSDSIALNIPSSGDRQGNITNTSSSAANEIRIEDSSSSSDQNTIGQRLRNYWNNVSTIVGQSTVRARDRLSQLFGSRGGSASATTSSISIFDQILLMAGNAFSFLISLEISFCSIKLRFIILAILMLIPGLIFGWKNLLISLVFISILFGIALFQRRRAQNMQSQYNSTNPNRNTLQVPSNASSQATHTSQPLHANSGRVQTLRASSNVERSSPPRRLGGPSGGANIRTFSDIANS